MKKDELDITAALIRSLLSTLDAIPTIHRRQPQMKRLKYDARGPQRPAPFDLLFVNRDGLLYIEPKASQ